MGMADYIKSTDFAIKDGLTTGDPSKIIKGTEINTELNDISTAIASKADTNSPVFTGNPTAPTQTTGTNNTRVATTAFVNTSITANASNVAITGGTINGVAITGGTVTSLATDLAVADGGTGASTFTANNVVLGNGTNSLAGNTVAPGTSGNVLTSNGTTWASQPRPQGIGEGQTWQDVTSSRTSGTTYTNNTGKPIMVNAGSIATGIATSGISATVGGIKVVEFLTRGDSSWPIRHTTSFIVPNGASYVVTVSSGSLNFWAELR
jgi:hypothetical protein